MKKFVLESKFSTLSVERLLWLSRLWKFEGEEELADAHDMIKDANSNQEKLPLPI